MRLTPITGTPRQDSYDVVIVGGAMVGSSIAWFLSDNPGFDGSVLVVEKDPTYEFASTSHTNSCMRQQFSNELNIRMSQFAADFVGNLPGYMHDDPDVPDLFVQHFGYMYLAGTEEFAQTLRTNQAIQESLGAGTKVLSPQEISGLYPFYRTDDIVCGSHNLIDEGYFDGGTLFATLRTKARQNGVEYLANEVVDVNVEGAHVSSVVLASGETIPCGSVVNASGPRAVETARMAGLELAVEPRKRFTFIFDCAEPLEQDLPLTIDPTGVHVRTDGAAYMAGATPDHDPAVAYDDFVMDPDIFEDKVWTALANRVPAFERIKVTSQWAGHYSHNGLDHNCIIGPHHEVTNFIFANGFSGHGLQQSPATGRGVAELIAHGEYKTIDLSPLGYERLVTGEPFIETAII